MKWVNGDVYVSHPREGWANGDESPIHVHGFLDQLKGTSRHYLKKRAVYKAAYEAAKRNFDIDAAFDIVERIQNKKVIGRLADVVAASEGVPKIVFPHPAFDDDEATGYVEADGSNIKNALPFAYARFLADTLGCEIDEEINQVARVGRTKLGVFLRFLCQPAFGGDITPGARYIIVDDTVTTAGTFAALRSYIVRRGGTVVAVSALAHTNGQSFPFAIAPGTLDMLSSSYGAGISRMWQEKIGHDIQCLTEAEGRALVEWARACRDVPRGDSLLQRLRDRLNSAAAKGS